ncbi:hypothetical protein ACFVYE_37575 [Streptomyces sp. NPDC058239]|uniref:hypothetical protein n=1 Tax=Streptomyces sp. NPDC058239 TaxID=3346395 RepID=UPI0036E9C2BE
MTTEVSDRHPKQRVPRARPIGVERADGHPHGVSMSDPLDAFEPYIRGGASGWEQSLRVAK